MRYKKLIDNIGKLLEKGRKQAYSAVNSILVKTYWEIVKYKQEGKKKAQYGSELLSKLSKDLKHGKGFSKSKVYLRQIKYKIFQTLSGKYW